MELLIKNIMIVDGTGAPAYRGTVGVDQGKICLVVKDDEIDFNTDLGEISPEVQIIDGEGLHLAPGFIDPHSHGDGIYGTPHGQLCKHPRGSLQKSAVSADFPSIRWTQRLWASCSSF